MYGFSKFVFVAGIAASLSPLASCAPLRRQAAAVDPNNVLVLRKLVPFIVHYEC